jgi:hypothetical protein
MWERKNWTPAKTGLDLYYRILKGPEIVVLSERIESREKITGERNVKGT